MSLNRPLDVVNLSVIEKAGAPETYLKMDAYLPEARLTQLSTEWVKQGFHKFRFDQLDFRSDKNQSTILLTQVHERHFGIRNSVQLE